MTHLRQIAAANGPLTTNEHRMLSATAEYLGVEMPGPSRVSDDEIRNSCKDADSARSLLQLGLFVALIDRSLNAPVIAELDRIRRLTGTDDPCCSLLGAIQAGDARTVIRGYRLRIIKNMFRGNPRRVALRKVYLMGRRHLGFGITDQELARKYRRLGLLPEGTMGRIVWRLIRSQDLEFPGEHEGLPEFGFYHDCSHVLSNYDTSPLGELLHGWFTGGYQREDPFLNSSIAFLQYYHAIPFVPFSEARTDLFEPERMFEGYKRGDACNLDLSKVDLWPYMNQRLDMVRDKLHITPRSELEASLS